MVRYLTSHIVEDLKKKMGFWQVLVNAEKQPLLRTLFQPTWGFSMPPILTGMMMTVVLS